MSNFLITGLLRLFIQIILIVIRHFKQILLVTSVDAPQFFLVLLDVLIDVQGRVLEQNVTLAYFAVVHGKIGPAIVFEEVILLLFREQTIFIQMSHVLGTWDLFVMEAAQTCLSICIRVKFHLLLGPLLDRY